jgi:hypothetical protein
MLRPFTFLFCLAASSQAATKLDFNRDIRPILSDNCFACHGFDAKKRKGDLRLDTPEGAFTAIEGSLSHQARRCEVQQRASSASSRTDPDEVMPPPETHTKDHGEANRDR